MKLSLVRSLMIALLLIPMDAFAHHGKEFLVSSTYKTPAQGGIFSLLSTDYLNLGHYSSGFRFSPGVLYGITNRWSAEFHTHHGLSEGDLDTESLALETRFRFLGSSEVHDEGAERKHDEDESPFSLAALFEYEKGLGGSSDAIEGRLITGKDFHRLSLVLNLILQKHFEGGKAYEFHYAFGIKTSFTGTIGAGIEFDGGSSHHNEAHLTPGVYASLSKTLDLRIGASVELGTTGRSGTTLRSMIIYSF